jgi:hypothetical protein
MPLAWWSNQDSIWRPINPLTSLLLWRTYECFHPRENVPFPIIWPSDELLQSAKRYASDLRGIIPDQARHIWLTNEGALSSTAHAIDTVVAAVVYPIFPNISRTDKPHDPTGASESKMAPIDIIRESSM